MSYSTEDIHDDNRIPTPEILFLEAGITALKESGKGLIEVGRALIEQSAELEKALETLQRSVEKNLSSLIDEARKSENHGELVSG